MSDLTSESETWARVRLPMKPRIVEALEFGCLLATAERVSLCHEEAEALADAVIEALAEDAIA